LFPSHDREGVKYTKHPDTPGFHAYKYEDDAKSHWGNVYPVKLWGRVTWGEERVGALINNIYLAPALAAEFMEILE